MLILVSLIVLLVISVNLTPVQNFMARKATEMLSRKLKTTVSVKHVRIDFLNHLLIQGLYIEDHAHDTLLYAGEANVRISDWFIMKKDKPVITYVGLHNAYSHLYRTANSKQWNYQFVIDAFDNGKKDKTTQQNEFELDLKKVDLQSVRFHMDDAWGGSDMDFDIGSLALDGKDLDLKKKVIDLSAVYIDNTQIVMRDFKGGKPVDPNRKKRIPVIDTTAFNTDNWVVKVKHISLENCLYSLTSATTKPEPREFDAEHLSVSGINIDVTNLLINKDTITAHLNKLTGKERCGLAIREAEADVKVSPNIAELKNLTLKTDKSVVGNYYAMHYERFPDFLDYIHKVKMEMVLDKAVVSGDEVGYFAPLLRQYNAVVKGSGKFYGSVDSLYGEKMLVTDGTSTFQGNLAMVGLPDINKTFIHYTNGAIATTGDAIMRYTPELRNNPNVDIARLSFIRFNGGFTGYIDNFAATGVLQTNLGTVTSNAKLVLPSLDARKAVYSGTVAATGFNLGALLRQPFIGAVTFKADVSGNGFDPAAATGIKVNAFINNLGLYGYNYSNITAEGVLASRKFDGKVLVDDPNLALAFNGALDFSGEQPVIIAKANLLKSDFQQLKLMDEPISAVADFDLNMTGNSIDNFLGSAKLYNINLLRGNHRVDLDSVSLNAAPADGGKMLTLESNDVSAHIFGNYQLSQLFYSTQYFLSGYLPNYIRKPKQYAPDQDLTFDITTRSIDSLLSVITPDVHGFDNSVFIGSLNTTSQRLSLSAKVPYGRIGNVRMTNVGFDGNGNFRNMTLSGNAGSVVVGDTLLNISVDFKTTLGNDSVGFNIVTSSPGRYGTATLNGGAVAMGDSLYLTMFPSEIYLSQNRWEISGGSSVIFAKNYLSVKDVFLTSGLQKVAVYTEEEHSNQSLLIAAENIDLAQMSGIAGFSSYQPDGRVNGNARIDHLFGKMQVKANVKATGVKLGSDTIGTIFLAGNYDENKQLLMLEEGSGIFRDNASVNVTGNVSFDSTSNQRLNGKINLKNAPVSWVSPFLEGLVSKLGGTVNGEVHIGGTGQAPDVDGSIALKNAAFKIDYLGTSYTIPGATIGVTNTSIDLNAITVYDGQENKALLTGKITHDRFQKFRLALQLKTEKLEVLNLNDYENEAFYGNLTANAQLSINGPFNNIKMDITASPAEVSHLFLPMSSGNSVGSYSYVTFRQYGIQQTITTASKNKLTLNITAAVNPLLTVTLILDPSTGDQINARGTGSLRMEMPADNDLKLFGVYNIDEGDYTFTFRQLFFKRQFSINSGSTIQFNGPIAQTNLDVNATYRTRASLYDLLDEKEKESSFIPQSELSDTKRMQDVNVLLHMTGKLTAANLSFKLELPEKRSVGTYAYTKFDRINSNDRQLFDQVGSLLLIGYFIPPEGIAGSGANAVTGAVNNMSEILSTTTSTQLTNIVNKLLGDPRLQIDLKYKNYNLSDGNTNPLNRNEVKLGLRQNFLNDRLVVEIGSSYDWGRPTTASTNTSNLTLLNNFRVQYLLDKDGRLRLNGFYTSDYDVLLSATRNSNITRAGVGIAWRKTFDSFDEFIHSAKYYQRKNEELRNLNNNPVDSSSLKRVIGTE